jgi:hypothetical protein
MGIFIFILFMLLLFFAAIAYLLFLGLKTDSTDLDRTYLWSQFNLTLEDMKLTQRR